MEKITYETIEKCKKLFMIIAENIPLQPNIEQLASSLSTTRDTLLRLRCQDSTLDVWIIILSRRLEKIMC